MKSSRLIEQAGTALLPLYLKKEGIKAYQSPEEDSYDFVVSVEGRFIRLLLKSINGEGKYLTAEKITNKQYKKSDFIILYLLDKDKNRFFTIPMSKAPMNSSIRFTKNKKDSINGKWMKFEGFNYLKKHLEDLGWFSKK
jgi:hypothetical protein